MRSKSENNLNVFRYGYLKKRPLSNIRQFFRNVKYAYQRSTKGYCDYDLWNLGDTILHLINQSLKEFSAKTEGYPIRFSETEWKEIIDTIRNKLEHAYRSTDNENPYCEEYNKIIKGLDKEISERKDGSRAIRFREKTPEEKEISEKYFAAEKEISERYQKEF